MTDCFTIRDVIEPVLTTQLFNKSGQAIKSGDEIFASVASLKRQGLPIKITYSILYNTFGPESGDPVNPNSQHDSLRQQDKQFGRNKHELRTVTKQKFDMYLRFLQTKNVTILHELERL